MYTGEEKKSKGNTTLSCGTNKIILNNNLYYFSQPHNELATCPGCHAAFAGSSRTL